MTRRLLNLLTALSLLLCLVAPALWGRAQFVSDRAEWASVRLPRAAAEHWLVLRTVRAGLLVRWDRRDDFGASAGDRAIRRADPVHAPRLTLERAGATALSELYPPGSLRTYAGFGLVRSRTAYGSAGVVHTAAVAVVPFWAVAAAAVAAPAAWLLRRRSARRRARLGLCGRCGYDLRATPGRCPECGAMLPAPPAE